MPDFHWCMAAGCESGQIHDQGDMFQCNACDLKSCIQCNKMWHEEETCEQYSERTGSVSYEHIHDLGNILT
jgi:hypothetical protein